MVELGNIVLKDDLIGVIDRALDAGVDADTFTEMVAERVNARRISDAHDIVGVLDATETPPEDPGDVIYEPGELPEGLIDLPSAAKKYGINVKTAQGWLRRDIIPRLGKVRAPGGGYNVTCEETFAMIAANPPKTGRPPK